MLREVNLFFLQKRRIIHSAIMRFKSILSYFRRWMPVLRKSNAILYWSVGTAECVVPSCNIKWSFYVLWCWWWSLMQILFLYWRRGGRFKQLLSWRHHLISISEPVCRDGLDSFFFFFLQIVRIISPCFASPLLYQIVAVSAFFIFLT
jgi:hypothetical protein